MIYDTHSGNKAVAAHQHIKEKDYWLNKLSGGLEKSIFPYDTKNKGKKSKLEPVKFSFSPDIYSGLMTLSRGSDLKLHMILTAASMVLLYKYTGNPDMILGTPIYKPDHGGRFINLLLPLRVHTRQSMTFKELLPQVGQTIIEANENRDYPIDMLPGQLNVYVPGEDDFPLFDIAVLLENIQYRDYLQDVKINMIFSFLRKGESIEGNLEYNSFLYNKATINKIIGHFTNLLKNSLSNIETKVMDIDMMGKEERNEILRFSRGVKETFSDIDKTLHQLFGRKAGEIPGKTALVFEGKELSYRELDEQSNQLARVLRQRGVGPDNIVALMLDRSFEMIIALLAILKAGGAYLPIDPGYPSERIKYMLKDSDAMFLLTRQKEIKNLSLTSLQDLEIIRVNPTVTPRRQQIDNLETLPFPDRSLVNYRKYHRYISSAMARHCVSIQSTRGCPFQCIYCFKMQLNKYVMRSAENIFAEIKTCYDAGARRFVLVDDVFNLNEKNAAKVLRNIIAHGMDLQLFFANGLRGDILSKEFIDLMAEAGTATICLALESASPRIQQLVRKKLNLDKFKENLLYIIQTYPHIIVELELMHGFPTETEEEAMETLNFLFEIKWVHFPDLHILKIYPNTPMYKVAIENGITKDQIYRSVNLAYHEIPETLPFSKEFTRQYQARFLNEYFFLKERLLKVLPHQMKLLTEDELVQKYDSYLPFEIKGFADILECLGITKEELGDVELLQEERMSAPDFSIKMKKNSPRKQESPGAFRVLLLDLSLLFTTGSDNMLYDVVEAPLGLMYIMTYLNKEIGKQVCGKVLKSRIDFDSFEELERLIIEFNPDLLGIRTLSIYKKFFHHTVALVRQWGIRTPIAAGGPYATSEYQAMLQDVNVDLAVLGEGEITFCHLVQKMIENNNQLPENRELNKIQGIAYIEDKTLLAKSPWVTILLDRTAQEISSQPREPLKNINKPDDLAYMIYTSGSTGKPKGVMLEHRNLVNLMRYNLKFTHMDFRKIIQFHSISFDVSFNEIFCALFSGGILYLIDSETRTNILEYLNFVKENEIKGLFLPMSFLKLIFSGSYSRDNFPACVTHIQTAGEQVVVGQMFREYLQTHQVYLHNHYGPSETHVVTALRIDPSGEIPGYPSIGKPVLNTDIYILNEALQLLPIGIPGELFIGGIQLGRGYAGKEELTDRRFIFRRFEKNERLYKTGDLAKWLPDGNIQFLGRIDHQVKIRGFRIECGEIESRLLIHRDIEEAVVIPKENDTGDKYLCAYIVSNNKDAKFEQELRQYLSGKLPDYMIPSYFMSIDRFPLTPSGKIDRKALPVPILQKRAEYIEPGNRIEKILAGIWCDNLGLERVSIDDNFFHLGGHSLKAITMSTMVNKELNVKLSIIDIFKTPTIGALAETVKRLAEHKFTAVEHTEEKEYYTLSPAQRRLFFLQRIDSEGITYNLPDVSTITVDICEERFAGAFRKLIARHESLRTSFELIAGKSVQRIHDEVELEIGHEEVENQTQLEKIIHDFVKPFDLGCPPLLRVCLVNVHVNVNGKGEHPRRLLLIDMHHIIADGVSLGILTREFMQLYTGEDLPPRFLRYRDYSEWQHRLAGQGGFNLQEDFWLKQFAGEIPLVNLPCDYPRPAVQSFDGSSSRFVIEEKETRGLNEIARTRGTTLFMVLLAAYNVFLLKLSRQEDIVVGSPVAGRRHTDLQQVIGMFVNMLALRNNPSGEKTFHYFLEEIRENTLAAFDNQDYPFEDLVEKVNIARDLSRNPLFDIGFILQNMFDQRTGTSTPLKPLEYKGKVSRFDLSLIVFEAAGKLDLTFEYCTRLFKEETIARFHGYFKKVIGAVIENPREKISKIDILTEDEKNRVLYEFNQTAADYPRDRTIHELYRRQAAKVGDRIALTGIGKAALSYRELNERSDGLARLLNEKGVKPDTIVGIMTEPSPEMITGILGILKAGAAYLPIEPGYPRDRIEFMLKDSNAGVLLSNVDYFNNRLSIVNCQLSMNEETTPSTLTSASTCRANPTNLAYIIYTSGTTGKPKGVLIRHRNVVQLFFPEKFQFDFGLDDTWTLFHSFCFDFSVWEMYGALLYGGRLVITSRMMARDTAGFLGILRAEGVTVLNQTPSAFYRLMAEEMNQERNNLRLRYVIFGGEALNPGKLEKWRAGYPATRLVNMFGITETTVHVTYKEITGKEIQAGTSNIGRPIPTLAAYILDENLHLTPVGVPGELCVSGRGLARGYLNRPELTAQKFDHNLWNYHGAPGRRRQKIYKSGDMARLLPDGDIQYLGRIDQQVKLRGYRIEPGEIENKLLTHPDIKAAVVILGDSSGRIKQKNNAAVEPGEKFLCAYFVSDKDLAVPELRTHLSRGLPGYMVPSYFIKLEKIPLTGQGKLDRRALPRPGQSRIKLGTTYVAPKSSLEKAIVGIWQEVLKIDKVGIHDNFFDLGGNSFNILTLNTRLNTLTEKEIPLVDIFTYPTIDLFVKFLAKQERERENITATRGKKEESVMMMEETMQLLMGDTDE